MVFKCENCDGNMVYHVEERKLYCPYCNSMDTEKVVSGNSIGKCESCGGEWSVGEYELSAKCPYCSQYVIYDDRVKGEYEPSKILPFKVGKEQAKTMIRKEYQKKMYAPGSFLSEANLEKMEGFYVPFWLYNYNVNVDFIGRGYRERVESGYKEDSVVGAYYRIHRNFDASFRRVPVDASLNMPNQIMDELEPYDYTEFQNFNPKYVSGFLGEIYNFDDKENEFRAIKKMKRDAEGLLNKSLSNFKTIITVDKKLDVQNKGTEYALLPVWKYLYTYRGKEYNCYINGQTGKVIGEAPFSKGKLVAFSGLVFGFSLLGMWILLATMLGVFWDLSICLGMVLGAVICTALFAIITTRKKKEKKPMAKTFLGVQRMNSTKDELII